MAKTWQQKFESPMQEKIAVLEKDFAGIQAGAKLYISTPQTIDKNIRKLKQGEFISLPELRERLAQQNQCDATCPLTTSIFLRICAEHALEQFAAGATLDSITAFWRVITPESSLGKKLSAGVNWLRQVRTQESS